MQEAFSASFTTMTKTAGVTKAWVHLGAGWSQTGKTEVTLLHSPTGW